MCHSLRECNAERRSGVERSARTVCPRALLAFALAAALLPGAVHGYGPEGHRVAGLVAAQRLCKRAAQEIARLGGGESLAELGLWADTVRSDPRWAASAGWHYVNMDDHESLTAHRHRGERDLLWAIEHFGSELDDGALSPTRRAIALRFFVHFLVDAHQPLHVGREADRGGNLIALRVAGRSSNLHRFWDTDVVRLESPSAARYARAIAAQVGAYGSHPRHEPPSVWLGESLALRDEVYAFESEDGVLSKVYVARARDISKRRLALAGVRLADELNRRFCALQAAIAE
jgi:nuclease S1